MEQRFKATVVWLILDGKVERALEILAKKHGVRVPIIEVGLPKKKKRKAMGCYNGERRTISVLNSDTLKDPFVILHEFYHHLRTTSDAKHRGTEKYADTFAEDYLAAYKTLAVRKQEMINKKE